MSGVRPVTRTGSKVRSSGSANRVKSTSVWASLLIPGRYSRRRPERTADGSIGSGTLSPAGATPACAKGDARVCAGLRSSSGLERAARPSYATSFSGPRTRGKRLSSGLGASSMYPHCRHSRYPPYMSRVVCRYPRQRGQDFVSMGNSFNRD